MVKILALSALLLSLAAGTIIDYEAIIEQSSDPVDYKDQCPRFICNDAEEEKQSESRYLSQQVYCFKADFANPLNVYIKNCAEESGEYCSGSLNRCVADPYRQIADRLNGNQCVKNNECRSNFCSEGVCQKDLAEFEAQEGSQCESHEDCNPNFHCSQSGCRPQKEVGDECSNDFMCVNSAGCLLGKCARFGSLEDNNESDNELICKSGYVDPSTRECKPSPVIIDKEGPEYQCSSVQDSCAYLSDGKTFSLPCKCGLSPEGATFCPTIYNPDYTQLLAVVSENPCHTLDRFNIYECLMLNTFIKEDDNLNAFIVAKYEREQNQNIRSNSECIKSHSKVS